MSQHIESHTATFLMTDIAGSTRFWEEQRAAMVPALAVHDALLRSAVEDAGGTVVKTTGDGLLATFEQPDAAAQAALAGQRPLREHAWPTTSPVLVPWEQSEYDAAVGRVRAGLAPTALA